MVVKGATFIFGVGLFGDPLLTPALTWIDRTFPNWADLLQLNKYVFDLHLIRFLRIALTSM